MTTTMTLTEAITRDTIRRRKRREKVLSDIAKREKMARRRRLAKGVDRSYYLQRLPNGQLAFASSWDFLFWDHKTSAQKQRTLRDVSKGE